MYQHEINPMDPHDFTKQTERELLSILKRRDPIWVPKLKNFIALKEGVAFRYGFLMGAILSALTAIMLILILR